MHPGASCGLNAGFYWEYRNFLVVSFAFLLAFDVNFMLMHLNSLDIPVNILTFTPLPVRSKSIRSLKLHRTDGFKAIACKHIIQGRLLAEY